MNRKQVMPALLFGALLLPAAAQAQTQRLAGRLDERTRAEVAALVDSARVEATMNAA